MRKNNKGVSVAGGRRARVCLVGAGSIAATHAQVLRESCDLDVVAIVDPNERRANALAARWEIKHVYRTGDHAISEGGIDRVHVCVPPDLHSAVALPFVEAGIATLVEKPLAASSEQARSLANLANSKGTILAVNHNFVHHPAFKLLRRRIDRGDLGRPVSFDCLFNVPLRQIASGQFGHWMFEEPKNLLLEQAIHPLSQICALAGPVQKVAALGQKSLHTPHGTQVYTRCGVTLECAHAAGLLRFAVGQSFPLWLCIVVGEDAAIICDIIGNRLAVLDRGRWLDPVDQLLAGIRAGGQWALASLRNAFDYTLSFAGIRGRSDAFYLSMRDSIAAFHEAVDQNRRPESDGTAGAELVKTCEEVAKSLGTGPSTTRSGIVKQRVRLRSAPDIVVLGGTGFIGRAVVSQLLAADRSVTVFARNIVQPDAFYDDGRVAAVAGDIVSMSDVRAAVDGAAVVINLAHGGGGGDWQEVERTMVGGARTVAEACLAADVRRLVHVGSIAGLYLGNANAVVTNDTPPDPLPEQRADYARGKAMVDKMLLTYHELRGLRVCILRPGIVLGAGTSPFHTGIGFYNNEQHCLGWNDGTNPLPLVLVSDVAQAIVRSTEVPALEGVCLNLVGDVRLTAREYIKELADRLQRPLRYHPQSAHLLFLMEQAKWLLKRFAGMPAARITMRDLKSRGLVAPFDCTDSKTKLGWQPSGDREDFLRRAFVDLGTAG